MRKEWLERDYYKTLEVSKDASDKAIKKAFRKLAQQYHPDANPGDATAEARFKDINEAYDVLGNAETRSEYDKVRAPSRKADLARRYQAQFGTPLPTP